MVGGNVCAEIHNCHKLFERQLVPNRHQVMSACPTGHLRDCTNPDNQQFVLGSRAAAAEAFVVRSPLLQILI